MMVNHGKPNSIHKCHRSLEYLTHTRPNISFIVNRLSQFMQHPTTTHGQMIKRALRYLEHTVNYILHIVPSKSLSITAYSNSYWASCLESENLHELTTSTWEIHWYLSPLRNNM